jgi:hypothetical protein
MGSTFLGDIPSGAMAGDVISHASVASNGAGAAVRAIGVGNWRAPQNVTIVDAYWEPTGADSAAANTASYRRLTIIDAGSAGAGTTVLGTLNLTASVASNTLRAITMVATNSVSKGNVVAFSHATVGGAHSDGTVLVAGQVHFTYRPI